MRTMNESNTFQKVYTKIESLDWRIYLGSFLFLFVILNVSGIGITQGLMQVILAIGTTVIIDVLLKLIIQRKCIFPKSAIISGLFIGGILLGGSPWYHVVIAGTVAMLLKNIVCINGKHIFNPAASGIIAAIFFVKAAPVWWLSEPLYLTILFGLFLLIIMKNWQIQLTYVLSYGLILTMYALITGQEILTTLSVINFFFCAFMLIEPMTAAKYSKGRIVYSIICAGMSFIFFLYAPVYGELGALLVADLFVPYLDKWSKPLEML